jgi:serine phosphatase RsbU (regulator of sigma subunit)
MIFLSHSQQDSGLTVQLASAFEAAGWPTWYYERDCLPGPTHLIQTHEAIVASECVVIVVSPVSIRSPHVEAELFLARDCSRPIVPVFAGISFGQMRRERPDWNQAIGAHVGIEIPGGGLAAILPKLLAGLRKLFEGEKQTPAPSVTRAEDPHPAAAPVAATVPPAVPSVRDERSAAEPYFAVQDEIIDRHERLFVGRAEVLTALDRFMAAQLRGYFLLIGPPGQGKSAIAAHLVRSRGAVHHFINRTGGRSDARLVLASLIAQLASRDGGAPALPESITELAKSFEDWLARIAALKAPLLLVIDALDEMPDDGDATYPFLVTDGLPRGAYVVLTTRPTARLRYLPQGPYAIEHTEYQLRALSDQEVSELLRVRRLDVKPAEVERIAAAARGHPLYAQAVADALLADPAYDLRDLPERAEDFFRRAVGGLQAQRNPVLDGVLGLLCAARRPLSVTELSQMLAATPRSIDQQGIGPIRQFLLATAGGFTFYHHRFHEFIARELHFEDEIRGFHRALARWLDSPRNRDSDDRFQHLAYHLDRAGDADGLSAAINPAFVTEKYRRHGYAVLDDIDLLQRALLDAGDRTVAERCIALVQAIEADGGGAARGGARPAGQSLGTRTLEPPMPPTPGYDVSAIMAPHGAASADFLEVTPVGDRLVVAIGDVPGHGLSSAFVARFLGNIVRHRVSESGPLRLDAVLDAMGRLIAGNEFFGPASMQIAVLERQRARAAIVTAGGPFPVRFTARRSQCDRLPLRGDVLRARLETEGPPRYDQRWVELEQGDALVLATDGLMDGRGPDAVPYGYRFTEVVRRMAGERARDVARAIVEQWHDHTRAGEYRDDVTVVVIFARPGDAGGARSVETAP